MDFIPLNIVSGYRGSVAAGRNFWESKHQNNSHIPVSDAIVALYQDETARITSAFLITKRLDNFSITKHETLTPILWVPAISFLYLLGKAEAWWGLHHAHSFYAVPGEAWDGKPNAPAYSAAVSVQ